MTAVATVVLAIVGILGLLGGLLAFIYARGDKEGRFESALDRNTEATNKLTDAFGQFKDATTRTLHDHDIRLTGIEASLNGSAPAHRNPSPQGGHSKG